jgi:hypothetical protein
MRKNSVGMLDDTPKPRRTRIGAILTILVGLLLAPLVHEGTKICVAQWKSMYGAVESPKTPVLDFLADTFKQGKQDLYETVTPTFRTLPWRPAVVIPFAIFWTGVAAMMLRRA